MNYVSLDEFQITYEKYFHINNSLSSSLKYLRPHCIMKAGNYVFELIRNDQHNDLKEKYLFCFATITLCVFFSLSFGRFAP